jgi:Flp pilus assembly protein TadG
VLLVLFGSAVDLGRLYYSQITINNAAKEGALEAARDTENLAEFDSTRNCDAATNRVICLIINEAKGSLISIAPSDVALTCDVAAVAGDPNPCPTDPTIGDTVTVKVTANFLLVSPLLSVFFGGQTVPIASTSIAQIGVDPHPGYVLTPTPTPTPTPSPTPTPGATPTPTPTPGATPTPTPTPPPCLAPVALGPISISPANGKSAAHPSGGTTFTMTAPAVTPQTGCTFTYSWSFGDALSENGATVTHLYGFAGSGPSNHFTVTLVIATGAGPSTTLTTTVKVVS